jgi:hypothetical protein
MGDDLLMIEARLPQGSRSREQEGIERIAVTPRLPMATKWLRRQRIMARPRLA